MVGVYHVVRYPAILAALSPLWAVRLAFAHPALAFGVLAAVILALTGAEALYADIGHFGTRAIRMAFFCVVLPSIVVGYFGHAATILFEPKGADQPFFRSVPHWALIPAVGIAMLATIIAAQAVISGAFSMTSQAIELGFLPRMRTIETSRTRRGQVYVPAVNAGLLAAVVFLVLFFRSSERLTSAYGLAVGLTMLTTSLQMLAVCREVWGWSRLATALACVPLLLADGMLFAANLPKIPTGGWFPVSVGALLFITMSAWKRGREMEVRHAGRGESLEAFVRGVCADSAALSRAGHGRLSRQCARHDTGRACERTASQPRSALDCDRVRQSLGVRATGRRGNAHRGARPRQRLLGDRRASRLCRACRACWPRWKAGSAHGASTPRRRPSICRATKCCAATRNAT